MNGICQTCGAKAPLEWFLTTAQDRQCMAILADLPKPVAHASLHYLSLFRPVSGRALTPSKAQRVLAELKELVDRGIVQVPGKVARPCTAAIWASAIEQMNDRGPRLKLPIANHNYLRQVAWSIADEADAAMEKKRNEAELSGSLRRDQDELPNRYFDHFDKKEKSNASNQS